MSTKLYGPDEGYEVVKNRSSVKKSKKVEASKARIQHVSLYKTVRGKISDLICDQELVLSGPPFNPVVNLEELSHNEFVQKANEVITPWNPEGHPPPGVYSPTMKSLIARLEVSRNDDGQSYASVVKDGSLRSSPSSVPSYRGSVLSDDLSESIEESDKDNKTTDAAPKRKTPSKVEPKLHKKKIDNTPSPQCRNRQLYLDV